MCHEKVGFRCQVSGVGCQEDTGDKAHKKERRRQLAGCFPSSVIFLLTPEH